MHNTAYQSGNMFFSNYCKNVKSILDVGSYNMNGTLRDFCPDGAVYTGVDLSDGPGVDIAIENSYNLPFPDNNFDIVVSSSCFEHDSFFWVTFLEMMRVIKNDGYAYISAPSNGVFHYHPYDCWRFYPDAGISLEKWACYNSMPVKLIESFIIPQFNDQWSDYVMIFRKGNNLSTDVNFLCNMINGAYNIRKIGNDKIINPKSYTEDQEKLKKGI